MIALYSFKKFNHFKPLDKAFLDIANTSVELAKRHMRTKLATDKAGKEFFDQAGIVFDEYVFLESIEQYKGSRYCMPKIYAMIEETEPYMHLDFDTLIFNKPESKAPVAFAFPEVPIGELSTFKLLSYTYKTYVESYETHFYPLLSKAIDHKLKWDIFPSNSIILVNNPEIVSMLYKEIVEEFIPSSIFEDMNPSFIEQFCIVNFLRKYKVDFEFLKPEPTFDIHVYGLADSKTKDRLHRGRDFIHIGRYDWYPSDIKYLIDFVDEEYGIKKISKIL